MKVLLVSPPYYKPYSTEQVVADSAPIGLGYLASYLLANVKGVEVKILDYGVRKYSRLRWIGDLTEYHPDIVGFSVLTLGYKQCLKMVQVVRYWNKQALVIFGGPHATVRPDECQPYCDVTVLGEGEHLLCLISNGLRLPRMTGIRFEYLDALPMPAYDLFEMEKYRQYPAWGITGSRGCPFKCIFCASPVLWGSKIYFRSPANIVDEIEYLQTKGIKEIIFQDDAINITPERTIAICSELQKRNLHKSMTFEAQVRANRQCVSKEMFTVMRETGFEHITFGIETGSDRVMKSINKHLTVAEAKEAVRMAHQAGIKVSGFFMVGNWGESLRDIFKTWYFIASNPLDTVLTVCTPLPGTRFYDLLEEHGYLKQIDWSKVNWITALNRTDKMSQWKIRLVYYLTVLFVHLPASLFRGRHHKATDILRNIAGFVKEAVCHKFQ